MKRPTTLLVTVTISARAPFPPADCMCRHSDAGINGCWNASEDDGPDSRPALRKGSVEQADGTRTSLNIALHFASAGATVADSVKTAMIWSVLGKYECPALVAAVMYAVVKSFERMIIERRERWKG